MASNDPGRVRWSLGEPVGTDGIQRDAGGGGGSGPDGGGERFLADTKEQEPVPTDGVPPSWRGGVGVTYNDG